jgi:phage terminase large subunit-like protein
MIELPSFPPLTPEGLKQADQATKFLELLPQSKGKWYGEPLELLEWEEVTVRELFGRRDPETGLRQYRTCFIFIPKKNGKSTLAAGLTLKLTIADQEKGAECYGAAYDKEQAQIVYKIAAAMIEQQPALSRRCKITRSKSLIEFPENRSEYRALAHDTDGSHGFHIHGLVVDEFHTWKDGELFETLDKGTAARDQPLTIIITTAGVYSPESPCHKEYSYACKVRDGIIDDPTYLPIIFETPKDETGTELLEWDDPTAHRIANPGYGVTVPASYYRRLVSKAAHQPSEISSFERLHLNRWTQQLKSWLAMGQWSMAGALAFDEKELAGRKAWLGLDLGSTDDLTAIGCVIPLEDGTYATPMRFFVPEKTIAKRSKQHGVDYDRWVKQGWITATPGAAADWGAVRTAVHELAERYEIQQIGADPWNALQLSSDLIGDGFHVVKIPQNAATMSYPSKELEKLVAAVKIRHGGNPVLTWNASNATVRTDSNGNIKPDKARSKEKIDGIVALVNGFSRALAAQGQRPRWLISGG